MNAEKTLKILEKNPLTKQIKAEESNNGVVVGRGPGFHHNQ